jgi:hypothetical protein
MAGRSGFTPPHNGGYKNNPEADALYIDRYAEGVMANGEGGLFKEDFPWDVPTSDSEMGSLAEAPSCELDAWLATSQHPRQDNELTEPELPLDNTFATDMNLLKGVISFDGEDLDESCSLPSTPTLQTRYVMLGHHVDTLYRILSRVIA